jgi:exodeoxyribonuclease VIII
MVSILDLPPGLHLDLPETEYHQPVLGMVSVSSLLEFARTPSKYFAMIQGTRKREETPALNFGRAIHCALLEPERFAREYVMAPNFGDLRKTERTTSEQAKENKARRDAWNAEHEGCQLLEGKYGERLLGMIGRILERRPSDPKVAELLNGGHPEVTVRWQDPRTGLQCRARDDCWQPSIGWVVDFKSAEDASPDGFDRAASNFKFHWIEAHYRAGHRTLGKDIESYAFVLQEKEPPYDFSINFLKADDVVKGISSIERYSDRLAACLANNEWPGYPSGVYTGSLKGWVTE